MDVVSGVLLDDGTECKVLTGVEDRSLGQLIPSSCAVEVGERAGVNQDTLEGHDWTMTDAIGTPKPGHQPSRSGEEPPNNSTNAEGAGRPGKIEILIRRADRFQQDHGALGFPFAVVQKFGNDQAGSRAALIAYYGLFALISALAPVHDHPRLHLAGQREAAEGPH